MENIEKLHDHGTPKELENTLARLETVKDFEAVPLLVDVFDKGKLVYDLPNLSDIQTYARQEFDKLWDEYKRILNPQDYPVDLSLDVWENKMNLIDRIRKEAQQKGEVK